MGHFLSRSDRGWPTTQEGAMGAEVTTIDFTELKRKLAGSDQDHPVNCAVSLYGQSVGLLVDKNKSAKFLATQLKKEATSSNGSFLFGTAYIDTFPGTLRLALNKAPESLATKLRLALRSSGFGSVEVTVSETPME
jgi:hypothetical protein